MRPYIEGGNYWIIWRVRGLGGLAGEEGADEVGTVEAVQRLGDGDAVGAVVPEEVLPLCQLVLLDGGGRAGRRLRLRGGLPAADTHDHEQHRQRREHEQIDGCAPVPQKMITFAAPKERDSGSPLPVVLLRYACKFCLRN